MTFVALFPRIGLSWPTLSSWKWLNTCGSSLWTIRCYNDKGRLLFLCLHFILLISGSLPLTLISPPHAYPGYLFHCIFFRRRQWKYYRYLRASRRISLYLIVGSRGRRLLFCPFSLLTYIWGIQFLLIFWDFRTCNVWIQMTNSNQSNLSWFFVPLVLVGSQTLATHQPISLLSILGGLWSDNTKLISTFYFSFFYPVPFHLVMTLLNWHYCIHWVLSHFLLQLNHWALGNAKCSSRNVTETYQMEQSLWKEFFQFVLTFHTLGFKYEFKRWWDKSEW